MMQGLKSCSIQGEYRADENTQTKRSSKKSRSRVTKSKKYLKVTEQNNC